MSKGESFPAFPFAFTDESRVSDGMTLRQYAAIKLKAPNSGMGWLDEMITKSLRDDFAAKAMQGWTANPTANAELPDTAVPSDLANVAAAWAYLAADAMLEARK